MNTNVNIKDYMFYLFSEIFESQFLVSGFIYVALGIYLRNVDERVVKKS